MLPIQRITLHHARRDLAAIGFMLAFQCVGALAQSVRPIDAEAQKVAREAWEKAFTKCGDSYYWEVEGQFTQWKQASFGMVPEAVSRADQMNGIQWKGNAVMAAQLYRVREVNSGISSAWGP